MRLRRGYAAVCGVRLAAEECLALADRVHWAMLRRGLHGWRREFQGARSQGAGARARRVRLRCGLHGLKRESARRLADETLKLLADVAACHVAALALMRALCYWRRVLWQLRRVHVAWRKWADATTSRAAYRQEQGTKTRAVRDARLRWALVTWQCTHLAASLERTGRLHLDVTRRLHLETMGRQQRRGSAVTVWGQGTARAGMRRWWHWLARRTIDAMRAANASNALRLRQWARGLTRWARWWWLRCRLPDALVRRSGLRCAWTVWSAALLGAHRAAAGLVEVAIRWQAHRAAQRILRALRRHRVLSVARQVAAMRQKELDRWAALLGALEVWRRPHVRVAETALRTLSRELSRRLGQWHFLARCIRDDRLAKGVLHARLASEAWVRWRAFITLPSRYDRLLSPLRRAALLPPPLLPLGKSAAQGHVDTFAASLRPLRPPRTPFKLGSRPSLHRRRASSTSSAV